MTRAEKRAANKAAHVNAGARNKGSGAGWGGGANGEGNASAGPGRPVGVKDGEGKKARAAAALEDAAPLAVQTLINVAGDISDQRAVAAAMAILNRVGLHEKHGLEVGGANGGPLKVTVEIVDAFEDPGEAAASASGIE